MTSKRYYVTMTWDDWPEGGSYGTVVRANSSDHAEELCREEMAQSRAESYDAKEDESRWLYWLENYRSDWHLVDCSDLDQFLAQHSVVGLGVEVTTTLPKIPPSWETTLRLLGIACRHGDEEDKTFAEDELARLGHAIDCKDKVRVANPPLVLDVKG